MHDQVQGLFQHLGRTAIHHHRHQIVIGLHAKIWQKANAHPLPGSLPDQLEIIAAQQNVGLADELFCPCLLRIDGGKHEKCSPLPRSPLQITGVRKEAEADATQALHHQIVLARAYQPQCDVGLTPMQITQVCTSLQDQTDAAMTKGRQKRHQAMAQNDGRCGDDHVTHMRGLLMGQPLQPLHVLVQLAGMLMNALSVLREPMALAHAVKEPQTQALLQARDAPRHRTVLHAQRLGCRRERLVPRQCHEMQHIVPVEIHVQCVVARKAHEGCHALCPAPCSLLPKCAKTIRSCQKWRFCR